jgi:hypothetical protein
MLTSQAPELDRGLISTPDVLLRIVEGSVRHDDAPLRVGAARK